MRLLDLTGRRFSRLAVLRRVEKERDGYIRWLCLCDCGNLKVANGKTLRSGDTRSCGCLSREQAMRHVQRNEKPIGYERIKKQNGRPEIKTRNGFKMKHIYVMEQHLGRPLQFGEVVHHKDGNILNNNIENLQVMTPGEHSSLHNRTRKRRNRGITQ